MLVTRRPILTSVEENGTFVPSKTRIGSGRIVPRIDESRAIRFCLPRPPGPHRAIPEIDRLANGCSYPSPCSFFLLTSELFLRLSDFTPRGSSFSHDRWRRSRSFSLSSSPFSFSLPSLVPIRQTFIRHDKGDLVPPVRGQRASTSSTYIETYRELYAFPPRRSFGLFTPSIPTGSMKYFYRRRGIKFGKGN